MPSPLPESTSSNPTYAPSLAAPPINVSLSVVLLLVQL
nr:MAG TPA: hypothetical protein [Bacteriophage sp.]